MYCIKCGADNSETAVYCRKCGLPMTEPEEETRVATRSPTSNVQGSNDGENHPVGDAPPPLLRKEGNLEPEEIFSISPTLVFVKGGYLLAAVGALLLVAFTSAVLSQWVSIWLSVLVGLLLFLIPAYYHFRQKLVRYTLTDSMLQIDTGFISQTTRNVPIRRIQDVTVSATPWQRLLGFGDVVIDNASDEAGKAVLKNINSPKKYADELLTQMRLLEK